MSATVHSPVAPETVLARVPDRLLIGGEWRASATGGTLPVEDPATGEVLVAVADADAGDALAALDAAAEQQESWAATPAWERGALVRAAHGAVLDRRDELAVLVSLESGKPLSEAHAEITYAADFLRWYAEGAGRLAGTYMQAPQGGTRLLTTPQPVGPCLLITPWNFPLAMATRKIAPALVAGCTAIVKPASRTPLTTLRFADILADVGLPAGVLGVVPTSDPGGVTGALIDDGRLRKLSFTGSTGVGQQLLERGAGAVLRSSMELGGNAPLLVFDDADLDRAVEGALIAKLRNAGQSCIAANRIYVQRGIADRFVEKFVRRCAAIEPAPALEGGSLGPLIDGAAREGVAALVSAAAAQGAETLTGGVVPSGAGSFYPPTVLAGVPDDAAVMHEEVFGPVAPIRLFDSEQEGVEAANATRFGLAAYVFTERLDRALRVADRLDAGMVGVNRGVVSNAAAPFGGTKDSGLGREGGFEGIGEYLETKYVAVDGDAAPPAMFLRRRAEGP